MSDDLTAGQLTAVARHLSQAGIPLAGPVTATLIAGGRSNRTFRLEDGAARWILRTPPRVGRTPSAHDVAREHRVTSALASTDVPVARPVLLCEDESVLGGAFTVAEYIDGAVVQSAAELNAIPDDVVNSLVIRLVGVLALLHQVDHEAIGLGQFGRPGGYAERQLRRWWAQWELVALPEHRTPANELRRRLAAEVPDQGTISIIHGDFRIDNTLVSRDRDPHVLAVVDWELSTLGDPIADVATMCAYRNPAFDLIVGEPSAWTSTRLPSPDDLASLYERSGGARLSHWDFHKALACFKIAVIAAGIAHRYRAGAGDQKGFSSAAAAVGPFLEAGLVASRGQT